MMSFLGMLGMHGTVTANFATAEADLVIAAGIRFDDRIAGQPNKFCEQAKIIHVDIDPAEIGKNKKVEVPIVGDLKNVLESFNKSIDKLEHRDWVEQLNLWKKEYPLTYENGKDGRLMPQDVMVGPRQDLRRQCHSYHRCRPAPNVGCSIYQIQ